MELTTPTGAAVVTTHSWHGPSDFDVPQRLVVSYVYELPFGKGKALANHGPLSYILGGFQTSGSLTLASGRPFTVFAASNSSSNRHRFAERAGQRDRRAGDAADRDLLVLRF